MTEYEDILKLLNKKQQASLDKGVNKVSESKPNFIDTFVEEFDRKQLAYKNQDIDIFEVVKQSFDAAKSKYRQSSDAEEHVIILIDCNRADDVYEWKYKWIKEEFDKNAKSVLDPDNDPKRKKLVKDGRTLHPMVKRIELRYDVDGKLPSLPSYIDKRQIEGKKVKQGTKTVISRKGSPGTLVKYRNSGDTVFIADVGEDGYKNHGIIPMMNADRKLGPWWQKTYAAVWFPNDKLNLVESKFAIVKCNTKNQCDIGFPKRVPIKVMATDKTSEKRTFKQLNLSDIAVTTTGTGKEEIKIMYEEVADELDLENTEFESFYEYVSFLTTQHLGDWACEFEDVPSIIANLPDRTYDFVFASIVKILNINSKEKSLQMTFGDEKDFGAAIETSAWVNQDSIREYGEDTQALLISSGKIISKKVEGKIQRDLKVSPFAIIPNPKNTQSADVDDIDEEDIEDVDLD